MEVANDDNDAYEAMILKLATDIGHEIGQDLHTETLSDTTKSVLVVSEWLATQLEQAQQADTICKENLLECHGPTYF